MALSDHYGALYTEKIIKLPYEEKSFFCQNRDEAMNIILSSGFDEIGLEEQQEITNHPISKLKKLQEYIVSYAAKTAKR